MNIENLFSNYQKEISDNKKLLQTGIEAVNKTLKNQITLNKLNFATLYPCITVPTEFSKTTNLTSA